MIDEKKLCRTLDACMWFVNNSLNLSYAKHSVTGYELITSLIEASSHNTYVETVSNKTDTLYRRIKECLPSMTREAYLNYIKRISPNATYYQKPVTLAFDYTDEDFYGDIQGFDIHGWTKKDGVTGKFKFLTCSIVSDEVPDKIPLISLPIKIGHYKSDVILRCLSSIKEIVGKIELILFDRGFYDKDLMYELNKWDYNYLIFVPKHQDKKSILYPMEAGEEIAIYNEFKVNKNFSKYPGENILVFLKQIFNKKNEKNYDWVFATNVEELLLENLIVTYKKRWRIETQFRVHDEAKIKCKSKDMKIRYFLFCFEQMLQTIWISFYRNKCSFKEFLIALSRMSRKWTKEDKN
ncbi:MAG: transposase [archaeon]